MKYLLVVAYVITISVVGVASYTYGRYIEIKSAMEYEIVANDYDVVVANRVLSLVGQENKKAKTILNEYVDFKKSSTLVNDRWLASASYFQLLKYGLDFDSGVRGWEQSSGSE